MGCDDWLGILKSAQKTSLVQDDRRKIHYTFADGSEMAEEYDANTGDLLVRKWKSKSGLKNVATWDYEVGEAPRQPIPHELGFMESTANPIFFRKDTKTEFQWRVRNLPYPKANYEVTVDVETRNVIIKTKNKKYYKKFAIPDLDRCKLELSEQCLSVAHANNTLIVSYKKPHDILDMEKQLHAELKKMKCSKDGDVECNPS